MCQTQRFWELLCHKIGRPELIDEPAFRDQAARHANREPLTEVLDEALSAGPRPSGSRCSAARCRARRSTTCARRWRTRSSPSATGVQVLDHPDRPGLKLLASPIRMGAPVPTRPAPKLGQDTDALLEELGYDAAAIEALRAHGVI